MKNLRTFTGLVLLSCTLLFSSCTKDQNENFYSTTKEFISQGKWSVDYYFSGSDKTALFSGHQFNFFANGKVTATDGIDEYTGTWTVIRDVNYNDVMSITLNTQEPHLKELNVQWNVVEKSIFVIKMHGGESELKLKKL